MSEQSCVTHVQNLCGRCATHKTFSSATFFVAVVDAFPFDPKFWKYRNGMERKVPKIS